MDGYTVAAVACSAALFIALMARLGRVVLKIIVIALFCAAVGLGIYHAGPPAAAWLRGTGVLDRAAELVQRVL